MTAITRIRIPATFFLKGERRDETAEFKLGPGPCGKTVTSLFLQIPGEDTADYTVVQETSDGERKEFIYMRDDLIGRIEVTYGPYATIDYNAGVPTSGSEA